MKDLFSVAKEASISGIKEVLVFFSTGKDSIASLDLMASVMKRIVLVNMYYVKFEYKEHFINSYVKRYKNIEAVEWIPSPDYAKMINDGAKGLVARKTASLSQIEIENYLRKKYEISYTVQGHRKGESLQRRGMLSVNGAVDHKYKRIYPIAEWSEKDVFNYLKKKKLPLPPEYSAGFRDMNYPKGNIIVWLHNNFPRDYQRFIEVFPEGEIDYLREVGRL